MGLQKVEATKVTWYLKYITEKDPEKWVRLADPTSLKRMVQLVEPASTDMVCDTGCGKGNASIAIAEHVRKVIAIDVQAGQAEAIRGSGCANIEFIPGDALEVLKQQPDEQFNVLICRAALHHFSNKSEFMSEAYRVLETNGRLYLMDPVMSPELLLFWNVISRIAETDYQDYCSPEEMMQLILSAGFCVHYRGEFGFPRNMRQWIDSKICAVNSGGEEIDNDLVSHLRKTIWHSVMNLPPALQNELHLNRNSKEGWFAYNCFEILAVKE
ncbi:MAG: class I SAM-dependent methyltransferase [Deltaproteobacteria bacterium]|nr:class I SAM-dependent methyltransferase [Deltaproteobacteria bacterium]